MKQFGNKYFQKPTLIPPQEPDFPPAVMYNLSIPQSVGSSDVGIPLNMNLETTERNVSLYETRFVPQDHADVDTNHHCNWKVVLTL